VCLSHGQSRHRWVYLSGTLIASQLANGSRIRPAALVLDGPLQRPVKDQGVASGVGFVTLSLPVMAPLG
jgi:hypothetical protein